MKRCLELARMGLGGVSPNPMVGCVLVHEDKIIGEGFHEKYGQSHAEVNAFASVTEPELLSSATLYANLEPCSHIGKTPACTDLILRSNINKVVIGCRDTNKDVKGGGFEYLRDNGCEVIEGVLEAECQRLNKRFFTFHRTNKPYIILKWAESKDGFIAPKSKVQRWITGEESRTLVHKWRTEEQGIMVGTNTVIIDNPSLTARLWEGQNPIRITIDNHNKIPSAANIVNDDAPSIVYGSQLEGTAGNASRVQIEKAANQLDAILSDLHGRGIISLIVEGGPELLNSFIEKNLWNEARVFTGIEDFKEGLRAPILGVEYEDEEMIGPDTLRLYSNNR